MLMGLNSTKSDWLQSAVEVRQKEHPAVSFLKHTVFEVF